MRTVQNQTQEVILQRAHGLTRKDIVTCGRKDFMANNNAVARNLITKTILRECNLPLCTLGPAGTLSTCFRSHRHGAPKLQN